MSTTATSTHLGTVADVYAAFGRGDVAFIMGCLADDIEWDQGVRATDLPWIRPGRGKAHVGDFFTAISQGLAFSTFEPQVLATDGDTVVSVIREAGTILSTGKPVEDDLFVHVWKFDQHGKVVSFRHIGDFARQEIPFRN